MIPLAVHSGYSFMQGTSSVESLCRHAANLGYKRIALTDTDNLCGLWRFVSACRKEGLRPVAGAEITDNKTDVRAVCLVKNNRGYSNLCRLISRRHTNKDFEIKSALAEFSEGLVVLAFDPGLLCFCHDSGLDVAAAMPIKPTPPGDRLRKTARSLGVSMAAVPDSFFNKPEDFEIHRVLRAISRKTTLFRLKSRDTAPKEAFLAPPEEYMRRFAACPEAVCNTGKIAERLEFTGPDFGLVMPPYEEDSQDQAALRLRRTAYNGAKQRYGKLSRSVVQRLEHELEVITKMGFCGYFLVVSDIVSQSPRTCGRGSGAASLVAYCLGITNVCPVKHNLYFERFLNPGRKDPPDLDIDFAWDERDEVIAGVFSKYAGRVAMVSNHVCFRLRMALRETARVFGLTEGEISALIKSRAELPDEISSIAGCIAGLPRCLSLHPGGVVITPEKTENYAPVQYSAGGMPVLQWDKDGIEDAGLVKIDLLGNRSLGVIRDAVYHIRENGFTFREDTWDPEDDAPTRQLIARGGTMGCFYIESPAMRLLQKKTQKADFRHLVIHSSIIRPAANEVIREYIRRLHGGAWKPIHPLTSDVLGETLGLMVFQEDVSRVAVHVAGFSHAEADGLRKVMSRKDRHRRLDDWFERFAAGAAQKGVGRADIEKIWRMIMSFSGYSFCKPHSASYARVSFQAAYLKAHFPAEFMAAVISNQGGFYSTFAYVSEAMRMGLEVLHPDVEKSCTTWKRENGSIRVGLAAIRDLSAETQKRIIRERSGRGFENVGDFFSRVRPDEDEVRALVASGALDRFHPEKHRPAILWQYCRWHKDRFQEDIGPCLFSDSGQPEAPALPREDHLRRLRREYAVLGFLCGQHPMTLFSDKLVGQSIVKAKDLAKHSGRKVRFAGWLITGKAILSKTGDPMKFVTFEDETGIVETVFFPRPYSRFRELLEPGRPYVLAGKVEKNRDAAVLVVKWLGPLKFKESRPGM
ncbi:MAG: DNA polymerase III subunit alpha [Desulfobacteraceae bacterium]|nr:DNA polymerase III subunit alpha [Desulfobacteraceae bacterium]